MANCAVAGGDGTDTADGVDVGGWLVGRGLARAWRRFAVRYTAAEAAARAAGAGIWSADCADPWVWRARNRER